ncbi:MAG: protease inhibitor I42 family protein [Hyphomonas sp.]|nr:protease inhibitor I42 family protein [Hyphomonas sp.]MCB9961972.1 protease inhibitor I42 family protein [Hyphomonas sp.]MCB9970964.1 protease inhibitor I42 family protein [Hyphomonas sp.]
MRTLAIGLAALALLGGRKTEGPDTQINAAQKLADGTFYAGADMNGKSVAMAVGDALRVELESIPTAGYVWQVAGQPDFLEHVGDGMRATDPEVQDQPGYTGGNHYLSFDFRATAPGTGTLTLVEGRPWELEAGEPPEGNFALTVTVTG